MRVKPNFKMTLHAKETCRTDHVLLHFVIPAAPLSKLKPDMVLEDVESDNECQQKHEARAKVAASPTPPSQTAHRKQEVREQMESSSEPQCTAASLEPAPSENATKSSQEDAETQTGRWTPFIQSIRKEAEDGALATMEER